MKITSVVIVQSPSGPDRVIMMTNLPNPYHPSKGHQIVSMETPADEGPAYIKKYFPKVAVEVVRKT